MRFHCGIMILTCTLPIGGCKNTDSESSSETGESQQIATPPVPATPGQIKTIEETTEDDRRVVMQVKIGESGEEIRHGTFTAYHPNGNKWGEEEYKDNIRHGKFIEWYSTGVKKTEGQFVDDERDGTWTMWDPNGNKINEIEFVAGKPLSAKPATSAPASRATVPAASPKPQSVTKPATP